MKKDTEQALLASKEIGSAGREVDEASYDCAVEKQGCNRYGRIQLHVFESQCHWRANGVPLHRSLSACRMAIGLSLASGSSHGQRYQRLFEPLMLSGELEHISFAWGKSSTLACYKVVFGSLNCDEI